MNFVLEASLGGFYFLSKESSFRKKTYDIFELPLCRWRRNCQPSTRPTGIETAWDFTFDVFPGEAYGMVAFSYLSYVSVEGLWSWHGGLSLYLMSFQGKAYDGHAMVVYFDF